MNNEFLFILSPYAYVQVNPMNRVDRKGLLDDWYMDELGNIVFFNSREKELNIDGKKYVNIGASYFEFTGGKLYFYSQRIKPNGDLEPSVESIKAHSGRSRNGKFDYSIESQWKRNEGPLPEGLYFFHKDYYQTMNIKSFFIGFLSPIFKIIFKKKLGSFPGSIISWGWGRYPLNPSLVVKVINSEPIKVVVRSNFFLHGSFNGFGSNGCIDVGTNFGYIKEFVNYSYEMFRQEIFYINVKYMEK